jgi:conjugal transfer/entry exclusion protein
MRKLLTRILARWADSTLQREVKDLQRDLDARDRVIGVLEAERDALAAVVARDRERIRAEGAAYARQRAEVEGVTNERVDKGIR